MTAGVRHGYDKKYDSYTATGVVDYLLRDPDNPSSVISAVENARTNARMVRTALTTEVWEAVNENWMAMKDALRSPVRDADLPALLGEIRRHSALVRGALHGTMLRNDIYNFARIGTFIERSDNTARILDVKYYVLLPSLSQIGSSLDNVQWETILRSVSAHRAFRWLDEDEMTAAGVARFLILDRRLPRSLVFSMATTVENLNYLADEYGERHACHDHAELMLKKLKERDIASIFDEGLHEFITNFIQDNYALGQMIERDYKFYG
jgi:uncharacterized alpha-E superfamily protein